MAGSQEGKVSGLWEGAADGDASGRAEMPKAKHPGLFHLHECVNGSWGAGMGGRGTYAFSSVLAVNTPCAVCATCLVCILWNCIEKEEAEKEQMATNI